MNESETASAPDRAGSSIDRDKPEAEQTAASRARVAKLVILVGGIVFCAMLVVYMVAYLFLEVTNWQVLADSAGVILTLAFLGLAYWSVCRGKLDAAGYLVFIALIASYSISEALWVGETIYNAISGTLLILLLGRILLPRKWQRWLLFAGVYLVCILLINLWGPDFRYDATSEASRWIYVDVGITGLLVLAAIWQVVRVVSASSIRTRLLAAFVLLVLLPTIVISVVSAVLGFNSGQHQAFSRLELAADLKGGEIEDWADSLELGLVNALTEQDTPMFVQAVLRPGAVFEDRSIHMTLEGYFTRYLSRTERFDGLFLLDPEGQVVASTDVMPRRTVHNDQRYFTEGLQAPFILTMAHPPFSEQPLVVASRPAVDDAGQVLGVLVGYVDIDKLDEIVLPKSGLGTTGVAHLFSSDGTLLATSSVGGQGVPLQTEGVDLALSQTDGEALYENSEGRNVLGVYRWLPGLGVALLVEEEQSEVLVSIYQTLVLNLGAAVILVLVAVIASLLISRNIASPLVNLAETASQVAAGNLGRAVEVERGDEIGVLAQAFNDMTAQVRDLVSGLERRVAQRTRDLEQRTAYLEASAEVARAASSILDVDQLVQQVVELIRQRFALYYVGLFLVDEVGEWAVLQAGTGEAGQVMLRSGHRIKVGEGMVGWCIANGEARIALEVGEDAVRLATANLPDTRSEAALPLRARGQVIGALTVQSDRPVAFDQETIAVFQTMADQVAVALENARLFAESHAALEAAGRAYGELSREAWIELLQTRPNMGYRSGERGIITVEESRRPEILQALQEKKVVQGVGADEGAKVPLAVPIKVRDEVVGVLDTYKSAAEGGWTEEEITLLEALTDQLGEALEGARLYRDTQRRAAREQLISYIVNRMRNTVDMDALMQTTIREVAAALGATSAFVQLGVGVEVAGDGDEDEQKQA
ncbi:MAG: GAF domain-containing protein [Anaerolineae bacterium]